MGKRLATVEELGAAAAALVRSLTPRAGGATLVTLSGELGAGKTAFTKAAAAALGIDETVTSPTFVLEKIYQLPEGQAFKRFVHLDAYRLEHGGELAPLGFDELMRDTGSVVFLEWPEKVADALAAFPAVHLSLTVRPDGARDLSYG